MIIIDYGAGNPVSVKHALDSLGVEAVITGDPAMIGQAKRIIFPGVGAAPAAMANLRARGLIEPIQETIRRWVPFLGVCLGMQILLDSSQENGGVDTLGAIPGTVVPFPTSDSHYKIPHIGWNQVIPRQEHPLFDGIESGTDFYFVHSFYAQLQHETDLLAQCHYANCLFPAVIGRANLVTTQFHPEKSGIAGLRLLKNFIAWNGEFTPNQTPLTDNAEISNETRPGGGLRFRLIPCLDVVNKRVTKGVKFQNNIDCGDPVQLAHKYYTEGADELVFYDITASSQGRKIDIEMVREVARSIQIPFAVGGGIANLNDMHEVLDAGAEKVSINSLAVANPAIIRDGVNDFGRQCMVLGIDPVAHGDRERFPSGYEVTTHGFRQRTGIDALDWARRCEQEGIGEIVVNSVDRDGTRTGFELDITEKIAAAVSIPVIASGGAGTVEHLIELVQKTHANAAIIAGMLHSGDYSLPNIKRQMSKV